MMTKGTNGATMKKHTGPIYCLCGRVMFSYNDVSVDQAEYWGGGVTRQRVGYQNRVSKKRRGLDAMMI